ncbi:hypothetical protein CS0771_71500 [Catellatospora sp. IY07-71]|uniref:DUF58 domain-containing protein n=1 Tax=Catellatospora sp. IY07-71 TaxID=2728827 RepID=UPI001BB3354C|nr:DUF58 domain-containing protein [Catellatospora sp. IY07-71]BCJ77606.1 hypothetical protein CS0771_71500 [Catellatospora sp. IY07-71]
MSGAAGRAVSGTGQAAVDAARGGGEAALRRLQLLVNRRLDGLLQGDYLGLLPGAGSEAGESREYRAGDDVRRMDWPVTARTTVPHVRLTVADRELETWLAVDLSPSLDFGTARLLKRDLVLAATAAMTHLTVRGGNRVGAVVSRGGGDLVRRPALPGRREAQGLLRTIARLIDEDPARRQPGPSARGFGETVAKKPLIRALSPKLRAGKHGAAGGAREASRGADSLGALIGALNSPPRRRGLAVIISDFLDPPERWAWPLRKLATRHEVLAIEVLDPCELALPDAGVLELLDPETGILHEVQTGDRRLRRRYADAAARQRELVADAVRTAGARQVRLRTDSDWLLDLVRFVAAQRHRRTRGGSR